MCVRVCSSCFVIVRIYERKGGFREFSRVDAAHSGSSWNVVPLASLCFSSYSRVFRAPLTVSLSLFPFFVSPILTCRWDIEHPRWTGLPFSLSLSLLVLTFSRFFFLFPSHPLEIRTLPESSNKICPIQRSVSNTHTHRFITKLARSR